MSTDNNRLITLAIHTYERAIPIKTILEHEGIYVELNNVNLSTPVVSPGVRIRIKESDLPLALRIVENPDIFATPEMTAGKASGVILVPTDFSPHAFKAAKLAMALAAKQKCDIEFLHAYIPPTKHDTVQLSDAYDFELADIAASQRMQREAENLMKRFINEIKSAIKAGEIPAVKFTSRIAEGIPEEAILEYARQQKPQLIVMGTRGANKKEAELIGSVTAEVLDSCRISAFTVPETIDLQQFNQLQNVAFFCNLDQEDLLALDALHRLFPTRELNITLIDIPSKIIRTGQSAKARQNLLDYCCTHYEGFHFSQLTVDPKTILKEFEPIDRQAPFQLLCLPNKRKNVFARVFNPSLAHKILFRADIPMVVIPV
jgi:nucleotide-binding universal stress UspA family protein